MIDDNGLPISRRASVEVGASNLSSRQSLSGGGPISLGSALKELQNATRAVLDKAAVDNAAAAAIVHGYEQWENKLRSDAQNRLVNGLATPLALTGSSSGGMKRSASENSLFGASESNMGRFLGPPRPARFGGNLLANEAHQSSNESSMSSGGIGYGFGGNDASSIFGPKLAPIRLRNTNTRSAQDASLHHPPAEELHRMHSHFTQDPFRPAQPRGIQEHRAHLRHGHQSNQMRPVGHAGDGHKLPRQPPSPTEHHPTQRGLL